MSDAIEGRGRELLEARNFCHVATLAKDATPHVAVVWVDTDGQDILLNSSEGRIWPENLRRDPRATLTQEGANDHIDALAKKYLDKDEYPFLQPGEVRLTVRISPEHVAVRGG